MQPCDGRPVRTLTELHVNWLVTKFMMTGRSGLPNVNCLVTKGTMTGMTPGMTPN